MNINKDENFQRNLTVGFFLCLMTGAICITTLNKVINIQKENIILVNQLLNDSNLPFEAAGLNIVNSRNKQVVTEEDKNTANELLKLYTQTLKQQVHHTFDGNYRLVSIDYSDINMSCDFYKSTVLTAIPNELESVKIINRKCN